MRHRKSMRQIDAEEGAINVIDVDDITFKSVKKPKQWTPSLSVEEERLLLSGDCLNDLLVNAAQHLLQAAHPHVKCLQDVFLGRILAFDIIRGDFVQVLAYWCCTQGMHTCIYHWMW